MEGTAEAEGREAPATLKETGAELARRLERPGALPRTHVWLPAPGAAHTVQSRGSPRPLPTPAARGTRTRLSYA